MSSITNEEKTKRQDRENAERVKQNKLLLKQSVKKLQDYEKYGSYWKYR